MPNVAGRYRGLIEVAVRGGAKQFVQWRADVMSPHVVLARSVVDLGEIFEGVEVET